MLGSESLTLIPLEKSKQLAKNLQCPVDSTRNMVRCLREQPIEKLVQTDIWFKPAVEKGNRNAFLPENPYKMLKYGKVYDVPWIASDVYNESLFSLDCELIEYLLYIYFIYLFSSCLQKQIRNFFDTK